MKIKKKIILLNLNFNLRGNRFEGQKKLGIWVWVG